MSNIRPGCLVAQGIAADVVWPRAQGSAIVGARRPGQVFGGIAPAADWTLSTAEIIEIDALLAARAKELSWKKVAGYFNVRPNSTAEKELANAKKNQSAPYQ